MIGVLFSLLLQGAPIPKSMTECVETHRLDPSKKLTRGRWAPATFDALNSLIERRGAKGDGFDRCKRPLAVFDFDNTIIVNDLGERALDFGLEVGLIKPTPASADALPEDLKSQLDPKKVSTSSAARTLVHQVYSALEDRDEQAAYAWLAQLYAGNERETLTQFAAKLLGVALTEPLEKVTVGDVTVSRGIRIRAEMVDLIATLDAHGFDVFIVTASAEWLVREVAPRLGLSRDRVIGIRVAEKGPLTARVLPPVTYRGGKVQAIRTRIPPGGRVPVFAIGDSRTDLEMLTDATDLAVLIDRGSEELRTVALGKGFVVQPAF
ncbi:MAG: HAD-IB family phosphatase [Deltaproteobacteria bacterium]|nr:HAD-IB family phosphatase [Deltaproteobacteria bacterium]